MERARLRMLKDVQCQVAMRWSKWSSGIKMQGHYERVHQPLQTPVTHHKPRLGPIIYAIVVPRISP